MPGRRIRSGPTLEELLDSAASAAELLGHPDIVAASAVARAIVPTLATGAAPSEAYWRGRIFVEGAHFEEVITALTEKARSYAQGSIRWDRQAVVVIGPPAAGKSSHAERIAEWLGAAIVDADDAKRLLPEFADGLGASAVHEESALLADEVLIGLVREGANLVLPKVGSRPETIRDLVETLKELGYAVNLVSVKVSSTQAAKRMVRRFLSTGRLIDPDYLKSVGDRPHDTYLILKHEGIADGYAEIEADGPPGQAHVVDRGGVTFDGLCELWRGDQSETP